MIFTNTRTGKSYFYERTGVNESDAEAAIASHDLIRESVKVNGLTLNDAIFYNIEGEPTYFTTIVANDDVMPKFYGFCSAYNKQIVGVGKTLEQAKAAYVNSMQLSNAQSQQLQTTDMQLTEAVFTVKERVQEGNCYYFLFEETGNKQFYAYSELIPQVRWTVKKVKIQYNAQNKEELTAIRAFEKVE